MLAQDKYDLSRFIFLGLLPPPELAELFSLTDLHVYLTVPFVLSWSLMNALACGATVLASDTAPVREMIAARPERPARRLLRRRRLRRDLANQVLDDPHDYRHLGNAGVELIRERYSLDVCLPQLKSFFEEVAASSPR